MKVIGFIEGYFQGSLTYLIYIIYTIYTSSVRKDPLTLPVRRAEI